MDDLTQLSAMSSRSDLPSSFQPQNIAQSAATLPIMFNALNTRRAIIPAANGHCSARALARYYAALVDGGKIPPPPSSSTPPLGSHPHIPKFPFPKTPKKLLARWRRADSETNDSSDSDDGCSRNASSNDYVLVVNDDTATDSNNAKLFTNPKIHEAFLGIGEYEKLTYPDGQFGLGFKRIHSKDSGLIGFGHSGMGGSTGFCDMKNRFAIAITLNKLSFGGVTAKIIQLVCSELNIPIPEEISIKLESESSNLSQPIIN